MNAPDPTGPLYLLPFDHRQSYLSAMFGLKPPLSLAQRARVVDSKRVVYEGFLAALAMGVPTAHAGILVDEEFGAALLGDAKARGAITAVSVEQSGSAEFEFEYGDNFAAHLDAVAPTFAKVLVQFNIDGDAALNTRQAERLARLSRWCHMRGQRLMFELLVKPTDAQLTAAGGDMARFDLAQRPALMQRAIEALQNAGVEPDVWKIEGLDRREDCERIVASARRRGRDHVGCIVLGRGADEGRVASWLSTAAAVPGFVGFAVGRTSFWNAVADFESGRASRAQAATRIAARFREWVDIFEKHRDLRA